VRIDKFLKVSRIIKRRTVANEACNQGRVLINGKAAKPATEVNVGDVIQVLFGEHSRSYEVLSVAEHVPKGEASAMYKEL
jgi:ribosomal 50S subunit-recycling heat shock protein